MVTYTPPMATKKSRHPPIAAFLLTGIHTFQMLAFDMGESVPGHFNFAHDVIDHWAKQRPDALALWCITEHNSSEQKLTFSQVAEQSRRAASFFDQLGIQRADRVLVILPRIPQWGIAMVGLIRLGGFEVG